MVAGISKENEMSLSIDEVNSLEHDLNEAKKEIIFIQNQYNKVVEQNKAFQKAYRDLEEMYGL